MNSIKFHRTLWSQDKFLHLFGFLFSCYPYFVLCRFDETCIRLTTDDLHSLTRHLEELEVTDGVTSLRTAASRRIDWETEEVSLDRAKQTWKSWCYIYILCVSSVTLTANLGRKKGIRREYSGELLLSVTYMKN